jgi:hypothetical protein
LFVVTGAGEEIEEFAVGYVLIALNRASEMAIKFRFAHPPKRSLYWCDHQVGVAIGKSPERDGSIFGNFCVRRSAVVGENFEGWKMDNAMARFACDGTIEPAERFDEGLGALVRLDHEDSWTAKLGGCEGRDESLSRIGEAV